jgi:hypothetical protein
MNPTIFVIFGITGDLAQRKLLPSLLSLYVKKLLPEKFAIIGVSRRLLSREEFRQFVRDEINIKFGQYREELSKIKEAIKFRHPNVSSVDVNNNEITFDKQGNPNNFHIVIRKVAVPQNRSQYKYIMWYVPFTEREDIDKPGMVHKKEGPLFDRSIDKTKLLDDIYEFFTKALLMN